MTGAGALGALLERPDPIHCSFCGKSQREVFLVVCNYPETAICDECIDNAARILAEEKAKRLAASSVN